MEGKLIAVRLEHKHLVILEEIGEKTGWNQSQIIRQLIENAKVSPTVVNAKVRGIPKKLLALREPA